MRCFIHTEREAVAVCLNCGKAMCIDCSALDDHSGRCPNCRMLETEKTLKKDKKLRNRRLFRLFLYLIVTAAFATVAVLLTMSTVMDPPTFNIDLAFLDTVRGWKFIFRVLLVCAPGTVAGVFFIALVAVLFKAIAASRRVSRLKGDITHVSYRMNAE